MRKKLLLFFIPLVFCAFSCVAAPRHAVINAPPTKNFVKVFKKLEITRCSKKDNKCEKKEYITTGSGLIIDLGTEDIIVLSAGHVCVEEGLKSEDKKYKYSWIETVTILNYQKNFFDGHVILANSLSSNKADLCSIYVPDMERTSDIKKVKMSSRAPKPGEDIYYMGAPRGIYHPPTTLIVKGVYSGGIDKYSSLASVNAAPGASGSVILSMNNEIYGVLFAVHPRFNTATIITNYKETKIFLMETKKLLLKK